MKRAALALLLLAGCKEKDETPAVPQGMRARATAAKTSAAGAVRSLLGDSARYELAIYWLTPAPKDAELQKLASLPGVTLAAAEMADYAPPNEELLQYFGRGLSAQQQQDVQGAVAATRFIVDVPAARRIEVLEKLGIAVGAAAKKWGGYPWDEATRELFTAEAWQQRRVAGWQDGLPLVTKHMVSHLYENGGGKYRLVTLGMQKFALPDLSIDGVPKAFAEQLQALVNLVAARLLAHPELAASGALSFELDATDAGTLRVELSLLGTEPQTGDADNAQLEVHFDGAGSQSERISAALERAFGSAEAPIIMAKDSDAELNAARDRARARLPEVKKRFEGRKKNLESVMVKAPFGDGEQREWMWVEVRQWKAGQLEGVLTNDPYYVALKRGAVVKVQEAEIFDWTISLRDGGSEGGETSRVLERREH